MTVEKIESGKKYERGMRYKLSFCNGDHAQYLTEMAFLELWREIIQLQKTAHNSKYAKCDNQVHNIQIHADVYCHWCKTDILK